MVFSSMLFLFVFLPMNLLTQLLLPSPRSKNIAMLLFSLVFYAGAGQSICCFCCWWFWSPGSALCCFPPTGSGGPGG